MMTYFADTKSMLLRAVKHKKEEFVKKQIIIDTIFNWAQPYGLARIIQYDILIESKPDFRESRLFSS